MELFLQNLLQSLRNLRTTKGQMVISSISLAVGIICITFTANWFWAEMNYDSFRPGYRDLYFLQYHSGDQPFWNTHITREQYKDYRLHAEGKGYRMGIYRGGWDKEFATAPGKETLPLRVMEMDSTVVELIGLRTLHGNINEVTAHEPKHVAITDKVAERLFGRTDVVGETLCFEDYQMGTFFENGEFVRKPKNIQEFYTIKAVVEAAPTEQGNFSFDILQTVDAYGGDPTIAAFKCLVSTKNLEATVADINLCPQKETEKVDKDLYPIRIAPRIPAVVQRGDNTFFLKVYLYNIIFMLVSLLLIVSAVVNLVMVYTSIYLSRVREYTLRRSMGASTWQNVRWMLTGILPTLVVATMLAAVGIEWLDYFIEVNWDTTYIFHFFAAMLGGTLLLCLLGMIYPVSLMRRAYLEAVTGRGSGRGHSHQWLIVVQCAVCAFLLFLALGMQRQLNSVLGADLGYDHENMLRLHTGEKPADYEKYHDFSSIFATLPGEFRKEAGAGITDAIAMSSDIFNGKFGMSVYVLNEKDYQTAVESKVKMSDKLLCFKFCQLPYRAFDFFNLRTRDGHKLHANAEQPGAMQVCLNPAALELINPADSYYICTTGEYQTAVWDFLQKKAPYGTRIDVKDVAEWRTTDAFKVAPPVMFVGTPEAGGGDYLMHEAIYIKYEKGRRAEAEAAVRKVLARHDVPEERYHLTTFDEHIAATYEQNIFVANVLSLLTLFSIVITFAGIFSMLLYSLRLRRRSMAIHRVMGAEFRDVLRTVLPPYVVFVVLGGILAYVPAAYFMKKWMEYFTVGETPGVWFMTLIAAAMLGVVVALVLWQVRRAMKEKPVDVLKPEA